MCRESSLAFPQLFCLAAPVEALLFESYYASATASVGAKRLTKSILIRCLSVSKGLPLFEIQGSLS
jgi:hypothetical protein